MVGAGTDRTKKKIAGGPAIVLVRPQLAVNIGMCARAMANFGLSDLRLVNPREGWPRTGALRKGAYAAAAGAVHLLEKAKLYDSIETAVADVHFLWATTARERGQGKRVEPPFVAMAETAAHREMTIAFFEFLEGHLETAGFFRPVGKRPVMQRNLRNMFHRMELTQQDVRTLWGAIVRLVEGPRKEAKTRKRVRPPKQAN